MAIEQRYEKRLCITCCAEHWVQVLGKDNIVCRGLDFVPPLAWTSVSYTKHRMKGVDVREKAMKTNFKTPKRKPVEIVTDPSRRCVAELNMPTPKGYASIKVFEDATPDKFYEWYWKAGGVPQKINSVDMGTGEPLDLKAFADHFKARDVANIVIHDRPTYNKLLNEAREQLAGSSI